MMDKNNGNNSSVSIAAKALSHIITSKEERKKKNKKLSANKLASIEKEKFQKSLNGMTKEEKIAANKARVAKFHPEPDLSTFTPTYRRERIKMEFEKGVKKIWKSIVSVPMGGLKKL